MEFFKHAAGSVTKAVDYLVDKNRRAAMMNRLKIVIKTEKDAQNHAYIQLGRYYYQNLRDPQNGDTETYCKAVDTAGMRMQRAYEKLDELAVPTAPAAEEPEEDFCEEDTADFSEAPEDVSENFPGGEEINPFPAEQEAADEDEDYLHPFSVIPNVTEGKEEEKPDASSEDSPKE